MPPYETTTSSVAYRAVNEDRAAVWHNEERTTIVVVDGAGGSGAGSSAAEEVVREVRSAIPHADSAADWERELAQIDSRIGDGEAAAVVVDLRSDRMIGASVGDCVAWLFDGEAFLNLTGRQIRKPLLGSRECRPVGFESPPLSGVLLVATDGFANYVKRERIPRLIGSEEFWTLPTVLLSQVQLASGQWWDDTTVVACRARSQFRTRQRYEI
jgi:serine/threonine protein phosphatase PrpC